MKRALVALLLAALIAAPALAMTTDPASIIALIAAVPGLHFDRSVTAPGGFNPRTQPYVAFKNGEQHVGGFVSADYASIGTMMGGMRAMAVPLDSGGSGGVFTQLIFAQGVDDPKPFYAGDIESGGHLGVNVTFHGIVAIYPDYGADDPNCCPKRYFVQTYTIADRRLKRISSRIAAKP